MRKMILLLMVIFCVQQASFAVDTSSIISNTSNMNVNVNHPGVGQVDWANFAPQKGNVNFNFSPASQTVLNRVLANPQEIEGKIKQMSVNPGVIGKIEWSTVAPQNQPNFDFQPQGQTVLNRDLSPKADVTGKLNLNGLDIQKSTIDNVTKTVIKLNY